jgi:hypothetical protein
VRVEAAHALWRVGADPAEALATLTALAMPLAEGHVLPVRIAALRYLADAGSATGAVAGIARSVAAGPRRLAYSGGWRQFAEDEVLRGGRCRDPRWVLTRAGAV